MKKKLLKVFSVTLSAFKYLLAVYMMLAGVATALGPSVEANAIVAIFYTNHFILAAMGLYIFSCGFLLFYGKFRGHDRIVGYALMMTYMAYIFATILQYLAGLAWISNLIMVGVVGLLFLRWKYQKFYVHPKDRKKPAPTSS